MPLHITYFYFLYNLFKIKEVITSISVDMRYLSDTFSLKSHFKSTKNWKIGSNHIEHTMTIQLNGLKFWRGCLLNFCTAYSSSRYFPAFKIGFRSDFAPSDCEISVFSENRPVQLSDLLVKGVYSYWCLGVLSREKKQFFSAPSISIQDVSPRIRNIPDITIYFACFIFNFKIAYSRPIFTRNKENCK